MLIKDLEVIREVQTVKFPTHDDVRCRFPQYIKGYVTAIRKNSTGEWMYGYNEKLEDAMEYYNMLKMMCQTFEEMNWFDFSEMYIYRSFGETKAKWWLYGVVVEE